MKAAEKPIAPNELRLTLIPKKGKEVSLESFLKVTNALLNMLREVEQSITGKPAEIKWVITHLENVDDESSGEEEQTQ